MGWTESVRCDRASSSMLGKFSKGAGGRGVCRATDNSLTILMALSVDDMKVILERAEGGGGPLYWRRAHCVFLGYTPCSTDNVEVLF